MKLQIGEQVPLRGGGVVTIGTFPGYVSGEIYREGGQGYVYYATLNGQPCALKLYKHSFLKTLGENLEIFKSNLIKNAESGEPDDPVNSSFIWPKKIAEDYKNTFGYVMNLRPNKYVDFEDLYLRRVSFGNYRATVNCAINMVDAFKTLNAKGYFYLDLNDGNFFIEPNTGDVLVCDNDNVTPTPLYNIGKAGYIAPELVRKDNGVYASQMTDNHSLAVVLFKLFVRHDPFEGIRFVTAGAFSPKLQYKYYGEDPIYIHDKKNTSTSGNPPAPSHTNAIRLYPYLPDYIKNAFARTFSDGVHQPSDRVTAHEWKKLLLRFRDEILTCACGRDITISVLNHHNATTFECSCRSKFPIPRRMEFNASTLHLFPGNELTDFHIEGKETCKCVGKVVTSKHDINRWGLMNVSNDVWYELPQKGSRNELLPGKTIVIELGTKVEFKPSLIVEIK